MVITPESSNKFPWIPKWRLVKPHANYCFDILKARWLHPAFAESYRLVRVDLSKEFVAARVWNAPDQWHNWRMAGVRTAPPAKLNVKTGPLPSLYFGTILLVSVECCFFSVFRSVFRWFRVFVLPFNSGFDIVSQLFSERWPVSSLQLSFPLAQTSS